MPNYKIELFVYTPILFQDTVKSSSSVAGKVTGKVVIYISVLCRASGKVLSKSWYEMLPKIKMKKKPEERYDHVTYS